LVAACPNSGNLRVRLGSFFGIIQPQTEKLRRN